MAVAAGVAGLLAPTGAAPAASGAAPATLTSAVIGNSAASVAGASIVSEAPLPGGGGFWYAYSNGVVVARGSAAFYGDLSGVHLNAPIVSIASTPDGRGYWLVASDGGIFNFGDAGFYGSTGNIHLNKPIVGMAATADGHGYWLVASDGGIFNFGDAGFFGSTGSIHLNKPVVGMAPAPDGRGYWLIGSDGGVFNFGGASFEGSAVGSLAGGAAVGIIAAGSGYWVLTTTGAVLNFNAPTLTSAPQPAPTSTAPASGTASPTAAGGPVLGMLEADPSKMALDHAAGITMATGVLDWAQWEPQPGVFNTQYRNQVLWAADQYRAAGWKVAIDPGLQTPPAWALSLPGGRLTNQFGQNASTADFEFSQAVRQAASAYLTNVVQSLGPMTDYRVGLSENGETYYPDTGDNGWWAFTPQAQGAASGLPAGVGVTPMPGWVPGTTTYRGAAVSAGQVTGWYNWYFEALVNALTWEIDTYRSAGYQGQLELVMPGMGALPAFYQQRLAADLAPGPEDSFSTLNTGAVWWLLLDDLGSATLANTAIDTSSVYDNSGNPRGNGCQAGDSSVNINSSTIWGWSDTRFQAYLARSHGLPIMGETTGSATAADLPGIMHLTYSCGLTAIQWAWDYTLDSSQGVTRSQLQSAFANDR